jgi:hypothetical protein
MVMKNFIYFFLFSCLPLVGTAQNSNAVFFSEKGDRFHVILNGQRYNDVPQTNVKVTGLTPTPYSVTIIFENSELGVITDKVHMEHYVEKTYAIKLKTISESEKTLKKIGNNLNVLESQKTSDSKNKTVENTNQKYLIKLISEMPLAQPAPVNSAANTNYDTRTNVNGNVTTGGGSTSTTTTTNTNANTTVNPNSNANLSLNLNVNANLSETDATYRESTTTTTTSSSTTGTTNAYVMPGYGGPVGCSWPMAQQDFQSAKNSISSKSFEDSKLQIAKQVTAANCLFAEQVREIMLLFSFEGSKLDFAKFAYSYTYDKGNYFKVHDAFGYEGSIQELNRSIGQ